MDKKFHEEVNNEELNVNELLDFLDENNTYFVEDKNTGIVGNRKTGVMIDKRSGKVFSENIKNKSIKYDFLDYKKSVDVLNNSDFLNSSKDFELDEKLLYKQNLETEEENSFLKDSNTYDDEIKNEDYNLHELENKLYKSSEENNLVESIETSKLNETELESELNEVQLENKENGLEEIVYKNMNNDDNNVTVECDNNNITDEELLSKINEKFNSQSSFSEVSKNKDSEVLKNKDSNVLKNKDNEDSKDFSMNDYNFSSFEEYEEENIEKDQVQVSEPEKLIEEKYKDDFDKFKTIIDFEEYLLGMPGDDVILTSPFEEGETVEIPKVVVQEESKDDEDDSFSPFDAFEVEEIESFDVSSDNNVEEGMLSEFNLNQGISKKVSIREVIKNKKKKKQEQKELQEKMFFETIDERIEQFKKFEEHNIDSQEILNSINMDLNKINSSIKIEFESLNRKSKIRKNSKERKSSSKISKNEDKFSLQNLLEEIYEENGEKPSSLDTNELDIESIKKDLANKERNKNIVN